MSRKKCRHCVWEKERERNRKAGRMNNVTFMTWCPSKWLLIDRETGEAWKIDPITERMVKA